MLNLFNKVCIVLMICIFIAYNLIEVINVALNVTNDGTR